MPEGRRPEWLVKIPAGKVWPTVGAGWENEMNVRGGREAVISVQLDIGTPILLNPGTKLVLFHNLGADE